MIASLKSLADRMRRAFGSSEREEVVLKARLDRRSGADLLRRKRIKVAAMAILFGVVSAAIEMPLPAEDALRLARAQLRMRPASQDIVLIAIDDATLNELKQPGTNRYQDSAIIDQLVEAGVKRIVFDRAHADPETPESDAAFAHALARHRGKVWLAMAPGSETGFQRSEPILPVAAFGKEARLASMVSFFSPFGLSMLIPTDVEFEGAKYRSISVVLADYRGGAARYRPDYAFNLNSIPTYRYVDVLRGRIGAKELAGKSAIIGTTFVDSPDMHRHPFYGKVSGSYFQILGANTLKRGQPLDLMWFPPILLAAAVIVAQALGRRRTMGVLWLPVAVLPVAAFFLDEFTINIDMMSAILAILFAAIGFSRINHKYFSAGIDAMTTTAISSHKANADWDVFALKIANLSELSEEWSSRDIGDFVNTLIGYVKGPGEVGDIAFERDVLIWLAPRMENVELERHTDGLALMLKTAISHDWQSSNGAPAIGVDTNYDLPIALRIKKAMQAADEAATRGVRFIINDAAHLEARNQRLELIRVLEKGLRDRNIGVAYQPKIDLASGRIVGAETLIRWRPDGGEFVNPQDLVLAAEAGDRINELTLVVMETALVEGKQAIALDPRFKLAVNMSAKSLSDTHLLFDIMTMLGRYNFPPENLTLELTETAKLEDHRIAPQIAALKARGICLSIDDFGTGESNLEYIEKLPSSELKIDKKFVQHMAKSEESRAVVRATIEIAHSLGKVVVAEGVEEPEVAAALRAMGCDQAQGYLFSQAIGMPELLAMMGGGRAAVNA
ncbi:MAG: EAL domain-containing protein [Erythrobacter sp.]|uniref:EAL domain-containing protein n=1 Tax=Erythrobacter sp. TaxID=1042 RepID=UPI0025EDA33A|nr:EAL domain-containing protein [Erythrobacter sp.]MCM0000834.1 EAL domain-containing protein [Erythrobacter sp.]